MKVGDKVVCITSHSRGQTIKGKQYVVNNIKECVCGRVALDVGIKLPYEYYNSSCFVCGHTIATSASWQGAHRFRKIEYKGFTNALTKELANKHLVKEGVEIIEPVTI